MTLTRCGIDIDALLRLRDHDLSTTADGGLDVATVPGRYRVPPAVVPLVAAHRHTRASITSSGGGDGTRAGDGVLFAMTSGALHRLLAAAATRTRVPATHGRQCHARVVDLTTSGAAR